MTIKDLLQKYKCKLDALDAELIIANSLAKSREFVLTYPENNITDDQLPLIEKDIARRIGGEPLAYITGRREFYGLDFKVNEHTLVPRPETEMLVEDTLGLLRNALRNKDEDIVVADIGTGSGNIIVSIAKAMEDFKFEISNLKFIGIDMSGDALEVARQNAKAHGLDKEIKFLHGNLLSPILKPDIHNLGPGRLIILANLPYLSEDIYESAPKDVINFEPKTALYSPEAGLKHYRELFEQIKNSSVIRNLSSVTILIEYSPEQKELLEKIIPDFFPNAKSEFKQDLAEKWRTVKINLI